MNNVILAKWHIALSNNIKVLGKSLKNSSNSTVTISSECNTR